MLFFLMFGVFFLGFWGMSRVFVRFSRVFILLGGLVCCIELF